jgi:NitT/TauT family transport system substrate-binding protein
MSFSNLRLLAALAIGFCIACSRALSSSQSKPTEVRLAVSRGSLNYLPILVAGSAGCFEKQNLAVKIDQTEGVPKSMTALLAGSVDVVAGGYMEVLDLVAQGRALQAFLLFQRLPGYVAVVSPTASNRLQTIKDLRGATVGVAVLGGEAERMLNYVLRQHGMRPDDVSVVSLGAVVTQVPVLERGKVDVVVAQGVTIPYLQRRHADLRILFDTRTPEAAKTAIGTDEMLQWVLTAQEAWLRSNPDVARRLVRASQCGFGWIQVHSLEQIREVLPDSCRSPDPSADFDAISSVKYMLSSDGRMSQQMHEATVRVSGVASQINLEHAYTNDFLKP